MSDPKNPHSAPPDPDEWTIGPDGVAGPDEPDPELTRQAIERFGPTRRLSGGAMPDDTALRKELDAAGFDPDEVIVNDMDEDEFIAIIRLGPETSDDD